LKIPGRKKKWGGQLNHLRIWVERGKVNRKGARKKNKTEEKIQGPKKNQTGTLVKGRHSRGRG